MYRKFGKRGLDLLLAPLAAILMLPVMLVVALAIRLDSPGPIFFRQQRVGRNQTCFTVVKFRTMTARAASDARAESVLSTGRDPRVTWTGRVLRRLSLDELPQLWNVLRGDMSLVGPRPVLSEQLEAMDPSSADRFSVRPGITGLAQVSGRRAMAWPQQLKLDVQYARTLSLRMDLFILLRTAVTVISGSGVYGTAEDNWRRYVQKPKIGSGN